MTHNMMLGPYTNHYLEMGEPIRQTTRFWQDALARLHLGRKHQERLEYAQNALKHVAHCFDMAPPQTIGEDCLDYWAGKFTSGVVMVKDKLQYGVRIVRQPAKWNYGTPGVWQYPLEMSVTPQDFKDLRRALYHTHRDPKMERLDRLKDLIANA